MPETAIAGHFGTVYIPGTPTVPVANIRQWDLTMIAGNYNTDVLGDAWNHFIPGLRSWNGTLQGWYDVLLDTTGQRLLHDACLNGGSCVLNLQTAAGGAAYEGTANITQFAITDPTDNIITLNFTYVGTGSLQCNV